MGWVYFADCGISKKADEMQEDFALVDALSAISNVSVPEAIEEIRTAPVLHTKVCKKEEMKQMVEEFLNL